MKILTVVGARPQFVKAATLSRVIASMSDVEEIIVHTGQHFDKNMSDVFFEEMRIPRPDYNLAISSLSHGAMTGRMLEAIETIILDERPDWVLVYGDTNSTLAGALAASKVRVKVAHVEAGLRSFNMNMPEEQNRILTDRISTLLFCPTQAAVNNLNNEGYEQFDINVVNVGDVMFDAANFYSGYARKPDWLDQLELTKNYALATIHRAENTDDLDRLHEIVSSLNEIHKVTPVILPLHPRTRKIINGLGLEFKVHVVDPVGYLEMVYLLNACEFVISDSGGIQKEAFFFHKQCLILRDETEWIELVDSGYNLLVGAEKSSIVGSVDKLTKALPYSELFYGDGKAANKIICELLKYATLNEKIHVD
ncbi:UDP-N-acetylglucosamine 2-epimerase (non-hydrolyzing) [Pseudomonadales bacterium]|nr:UDP-N-acetylglucosamine 2-epimerase (non-hydrolyzing) [Pseudomonadales bacterium]